MELGWLRLMNFKNCAEREFSFGHGLHCIVGANGKGKTNVLDAIFYLCFTKSFLHTSDTQNIRIGEPYFMIEGRFPAGETEDLVQVSFKKGQKKSIRKNKKEYEKLADHIGLFPAVLVCPQYSTIITGGSEERRRWMDGFISQFSKAYLLDLLHYQRVLQQRNTLIRQMTDAHRWDEATLLVYDEQLEKYGTSIYQTRKTFIEDFLPGFNDIYQTLSGGAEKIDLEYSSVLGQGASITDILLQTRQKDRSLQYTSAGIHKDDLDFSLQGMSMKKFGSQGQQKTYLMALKLAEHHYLRQKLGTTPLLLLDDIFDKLDQDRVKQLIKIVSSDGFGQVFITDTGRKKLEEIFRELDIEALFYDI